MNVTISIKGRRVELNHRQHGILALVQAQGTATKDDCVDLFPITQQINVNRSARTLIELGLIERVRAGISGYYGITRLGASVAVPSFSPMFD